MKSDQRKKNLEASNHNTGQDTEETNDSHLPFLPSCRKEAPAALHPVYHTDFQKGNYIPFKMSKDVAVVKKTTTEEEEYTIKPQATTPSLDTSEWPLLLKNYDKRESPDRIL
jgi:hypothetical protein